MATLATRNPAGDADLVPVTYALAAPDTVVTAVDHKPKRHGRLQRLGNVERHPGVTLLVDHYEDEWEALWWVRLRATARVVEPADAEHATVVAALALRYPQYRDRPPSGPAIVMTVHEWRGWAAASPQPPPPNLRG